MTEAGEEEARQLAVNFPFHDRIGAVFASPLQRALQTALLAFRVTLSPCSKVIAVPLAQETSNAPCDTGQDLKALEIAFSAADVDFHLVEDGWNSKAGQDDDVGPRRAAEVRDFLAARAEHEVVLVTHGYFLRYLTEVCFVRSAGCSARANAPDQDWEDLWKDGLCKSYESREIRFPIPVRPERDWKTFAYGHCHDSRERE